MQKLDQEITMIGERKDELATKLADLDSLKYVMEELEDKISDLKKES